MSDARKRSSYEAIGENAVGLPVKRRKVRTVLEEVSNPSHDVGHELLHSSTTSSSPSNDPEQYAPPVYFLNLPKKNINITNSFSVIAEPLTNAVSRLLAYWGATNFDFVDVNGLTPLDVAIQKKKYGIAKLFLELGAHPGVNCAYSVYCLFSDSSVEAREFTRLYIAVLSHMCEQLPVPLKRCLLTSALQHERYRIFYKLVQSGITSPDLGSSGANILLCVADVPIFDYHILVSLHNAGNALEVPGLGLEPLLEAYIYNVSRGVNVGAGLGCIAYLLSVGASPNITLRNGTKALLAALHSPLGGLLDLLLEYGANTHSVSGPERPGLLAQAVRIGSLQKVKALLKAKVDVNQVTKSGNSALHYALGLNRLEIAELIIKAHADFLTPNAKGISVFDLILHNDLASLLSLICQKSSFHLFYKGVPGESAVTHVFHRAIRRRKPNIVRCLLTSVNINNPSGTTGLTAFRQALYTNNCEIIKILLDAGVDYSPDLYLIYGKPLRQTFLTPDACETCISSETKKYVRSCLLNVTSAVI